MSMTVINTRPASRAAPLTEHLKAAGINVVDLPMLALMPRKITDQEIDLMRRWLTGGYQALVVVSPTAATQACALWQQLQADKDATAINNSAPSDIISVGSATTQALITACPHLQGQIREPIIANNEGMLAMPEIARLQAYDKLLVWRGLGGRRLLVDTLRARGVLIDSIAWYERVMPKTAIDDYQRWSTAFFQKGKTDHKPVVIISSGTAFEHWQHVVQASGAQALTDFRYIVLGARLADMVAAAHLEHSRVEDLDPQTILDAL